MARQLPGPICPLAPHGTESGRTGTLIGPADTAASGPLPGLHQKPQGPGETGPRCARRLRPSCEAAVPPPRARSRCPGRAKLVSVKNPKDMGLATRNWARLHSAEGASPPHSHQTARPRAPAVPTRRWASRRRAEVGPMGTTRSRGSGPCMHRHVCACVRACYVCGAAGTRQGCASRTERGWRRGRRAPQRVAWTRSLREQRPCPQAPVTAGGAAPGAAGSRRIFPPTRPKGRLQPQSRLQAAGPPLCPAVPGKGHEAGHHQRQHGAGGASPPPG